jgi:predicted DCC family thiol-disulfide oxidoreductase YuxK
MSAMETSVETAKAPLTTPEHQLLLFFDGTCSFCARWVARVLEADTEHRIRIATLQGPSYQRVLAAHPELRKIDSAVVLKRVPAGLEDVFIRSSAIRKVVEGLPGFRAFAFVLQVVPTPISDLGYWIFSKLREPLFGRWANCRPDLEKSPLFLD